MLAVTGLGATITAAVKNAYTAVDMIQFEGKQARTDIAHRGKGARSAFGRSNSCSVCNRCPAKRSQEHQEAGFGSQARNK